MKRIRVTSIKECRMKVGLTQPQAAEMLDIGDIRTYQYMEDGAIALKVKTMHRMTRLFKCSFDDLLALPPHLPVQTVQDFLAVES